MATVTSNVLGVKLSDTGTTAAHALGTRVLATDGQEHVYVKASSAIAAYDFVGVDEDFLAAPLTKTMADAGWQIGVAQNAIASGSYGFVAARGANLTGFLKASCLADVALYTSATAGKLDDSSTSQTKINGVVAVTANSSNTARAKEVLLTFPRSTTF